MLLPGASDWLDHDKDEVPSKILCTLVLYHSYTLIISGLGHSLIPNSMVSVESPSLTTLTPVHCNFDIACTLNNLVIIDCHTYTGTEENIYVTS